MITGTVKSAEGRIRLTVKGPGKRTQEVEAVVDTGYTASLTLPPVVIANLGLRWQTMDTAKLADGSECVFNYLGRKARSFLETFRHVLQVAPTSLAGVERGS